MYDGQTRRRLAGLVVGNAGFGPCRPGAFRPRRHFSDAGGNRGIYLHHDGFGNRGDTGRCKRSCRATRRRASAWWGRTSSFCRLQAPVKVSAGRPGRPAIGWQAVRIPLADLGAGRERADGDRPCLSAGHQNAPLPLVVDDISLLPDQSLPPAPTQATVAVTVNAQAGRHPISPFIYGMAFAPDDYLTDLRLGVNRWGGNDKSRYNWVQGNADNAARDWYFRNRYASDGSVPARPRRPPPTGLCRPTRPAGRRLC